MHPLLTDPEQEPETRPEATDVLSHWLTARGFKLNEPTPGGFSRYSQGYFTKGTSNCANWSWYNPFDHAVIGYRGGGPTNVRARLRAVAEVLEQLGVEYDVEVNSASFPML
jgi:hypothetical protein